MVIVDLVIFGGATILAALFHLAVFLNTTRVVFEISAQFIAFGPDEHAVWEVVENIERAAIGGPGGFHGLTEVLNVGLPGLNLYSHDGHLPLFLMR
ncbi:hypothetical protein IV102_24930 [bacterium]|nr:hypothetical protein [bacterium]